MYVCVPIFVHAAMCKSIFLKTEERLVKVTRAHNITQGGAGVMKGNCEDAKRRMKE